MNKRHLRVAIIGTAKRSDDLYGPLIQALSDDVELVSVWGRHADSVERLVRVLVYRPTPTWRNLFVKPRPKRAS